MNELKRLLDSVRGGDKAAFELLSVSMKKPLLTIILQRKYTSFWVFSRNTQNHC